jgi:hypothetical protein
VIKKMRAKRKSDISRPDPIKTIKTCGKGIYRMMSYRR